MLLIIGAWLVVAIVAWAILRAAALADRASLLVAAAVSLSGAAAAADAQASSRCPGADAEATLCLINHERQERGLPPLERNTRLAVAAQLHSADMVARGFFSHVSPGGGTIADRLRRAGYTDGCAWRAGETLAWGSGAMRAPASRVRAWMESRRHREVLLGAAYRDAGIGIARGLPGRSGDGLTYTAQFGRRWC